LHYFEGVVPEVSEEVLGVLVVVVFDSVVVVVVFLW
jgi:hypothetical protein